MKELFTGIMTYFNADKSHAFYTGIGGRLYLSEAPQNTVYPYCVYFMMNDMPEHWFGGEVIEDVSIQFNIYSSDHSAIQITNLYNYLKSRFDECVLAVSGYSQLTFMRQMANLLREEERDVWQCAVEYQVLLEI